jgi:hypothetical protein
VLLIDLFWFAYVTYHGRTTPHMPICRKGLVCVEQELASLSTFSNEFCWYPSPKIHCISLLHLTDNPISSIQSILQFEQLLALTAKQLATLEALASNVLLLKTRSLSPLSSFLEVVWDISTYTTCFHWASSCVVW